MVAFDLLGTFVFALSGAVAGVRHRLDLFGVLVLSFAAATAGGLFRDVLIGVEVPAAIRGRRYVAVSVLAGLVTFYRPSGIQRFRNSVLWFDAAGLALFAVTGTSKALAYSVNPVSAALLGMLTGIGGGVVRDVLVSEVPTVFRAELYAVTALAGAAVRVSATACLTRSGGHAGAVRHTLLAASALNGEAGVSGARRRAANRPRPVERLGVPIPVLPPVTRATLSVKSSSVWR